MKPQDILFIIVLVGLLFKFWRKPQIIIIAGTVCLIASIPLFSVWIFFTAQRLVYYSLGFLTLGIICLLPILQKRGYNKGSSDNKKKQI